MNRARLRTLRNVISGIPETNVDLSFPHVDEKNLCGSLGCIGGWASAYPPFKQMGIRGDWEGFFGLTFKQSRLFDFRQPNERGTDKEIALRRLDALLRR